MYGLFIQYTFLLRPVVFYSLPSVQVILKVGTALFPVLFSIVHISPYLLPLLPPNLWSERSWPLFSWPDASLGLIFATSGGTLRLHSPACLLSHSWGGRRALLCSASRGVSNRCSSFCTLILPVLISGHSLSLPYDSCRRVFSPQLPILFRLFLQPALFCVQKTVSFCATRPFLASKTSGFLDPFFYGGPTCLFSQVRHSWPVLLGSRPILPSVDAFLGLFATHALLLGHPLWTYRHHSFALSKVP